MNDKVSHPAQLAYVRRYTLTHGKEAGLRVTEVQCGRLRFLLNESKALDVMQLWHDGMNVSFLSKNGFSPRENGFLNRFEGGMVYTCGLDSVGGREGYELHGTLHNIPAEVVRAECTERGVEVEGIIRDSALFGKNLVLRRKIFVGSDSAAVEICDTLTNEGYADENYCLLYHVNLGYPMLDEGCKIQADISQIVPRNDHAKKHREKMLEITEPVRGGEETCYFLKLRTPRASLHNPKLGKTFTLEYSGDTLPHFVEWKSMVSGDYALGLEPCTTELDDRFAYKVLPSQKSVQFRLRIEID